MNVHAPVTVPITYEMVARAYQKVKQGGKAAGIDGESWTSFEDKRVEKELFVIWRRLASGSYFPQPVREVEIPKKNGKTRKLGIPTIRDRIAQEVVKSFMEKRVDHQFHENSYGYRPLKNSHDALQAVRENNRAKDWVIDLDISQFFDEIDHHMMLKAVEWMFDERWVSVYVKRWLEMKIVRADGSQYDREGKGTPQGGVISPLLANLFLHFALDLWLSQHHPTVRFVRYADDVVIHCGGKEEAENLLQAIRARLSATNLRLNEAKTRLVYCKDYRRKAEYQDVQYDFLGFSFQPRKCVSSRYPGRAFTAFTGEISRENQLKIIRSIKDSLNWNHTELTIAHIASLLNAQLRGWINYFGHFGRSDLTFTLHYLDHRLVKWLQRKHKCNTHQAWRHLIATYRVQPTLFYHWEKRYCLVRN